MLKKNKMIIAVAVFCTGVLFGGIGTGIAIAEYTSLEYTGIHNLGAEYMKTENFDVTVDLEEGKKIEIIDNYWMTGIDYDASVPVNTVRYVVTYNSDLMNFSADYMAYEENSDVENPYQGYVYLNHLYKNSEFDLIMRNKDKILEDLKRGRFGTYLTGGIETVEVLVNPEMKLLFDF